MPDTTPHEPTANTISRVEGMAAIGIAQEDIAKVIGIDPKTLRKHYRAVLDTAMIKADAAVGGALYKKAVNGDTTAQIFWAKTRMGWKETIKNENQQLDENGNPVSVTSIKVCLESTKDNAS